MKGGNSLTGGLKRDKQCVITPEADSTFKQVYVYLEGQGKIDVRPPSPGYSVGQPADQA